VSAPHAAQLAGRDALAIDAHYQDEGGVTHVRALFVPRGSIVYQVVLGLPGAYPDYERVGDELLEAIRFTEPRELRQARARSLLSPGGMASLTGLGVTLGQLGDTAEAAELLLRAETLKPGDGELRALRAEALLQSAQRESGCQEARAAAELAPRSDEAALAVSDCRAAGGDREGAKQELRRAATLAPDDRRVARRLDALH
jgi:tetratricopeptide (TPR) repeat protein